MQFSSKIVTYLQANVYKVGEETELFVSIYSKTGGKLITEEFLISLNKSAVPIDILQDHKLSTIFKDIENNDFDMSLHLLCRVVRKGRLAAETDTKKGYTGTNNCVDQQLS
jgi:hypothetical protein